MQVHLWDLHTEVSWFSAVSALKPAEYLMHSAFSFSSRKEKKQQYNSDYGNSVMFTFNWMLSLFLKEPKKIPTSNKNNQM